MPKFQIVSLSRFFRDCVFVEIFGGIIMDLFGKRDVTGSRPRIVLYSHDTMGLGHMRRNLLIAQSLANSALEANVLMIAGAFAANVFASSAGIDCLTLPALHKFGNGQYKSRNLNVELEEIIKFREKTICAATDAFDPDVLIVDNVPRGVHRELDSTLKLLKQRGKTRLVLGLRDVLDDPATVRREWQAANNEQTHPNERLKLLGMGRLALKEKLTRQV